MSPEMANLEAKRRADIDAIGEFLRAHNLSVLVFPKIPTGNVFWVTRQPSELPLGKGKTLVEALENAGVVARAS